MGAAPPTTTPAGQAAYVSSAEAPEMISTSSVVMRAWRARLYWMESSLMRSSPFLDAFCRGLGGCCCGCVPNGQVSQPASQVWPSAHRQPRRQRTSMAFIREDCSAAADSSMEVKRVVEMASSYMSSSTSCYWCCCWVHVHRQEERGRQRTARPTDRARQACTPGKALPNPHQHTDHPRSHQHHISQHPPTHTRQGRAGQRTVLVSGSNSYST